MAWREGSTGETRTGKELIYDGRERIRPQDGYRQRVKLFLDLPLSTIQHIFTELLFCARHCAVY